MCVCTFAVDIYKQCNINKIYHRISFNPKFNISNNTLLNLTSLLDLKGKKISNDQELIQSDPISCPQNQKGNNLIHKLTTVYERHSRQTE